MTVRMLSSEQQETVLRLAADGRHADVLALLADWPTDVEQSPRLALAYGTANARLGRTAEGVRWVEHALAGARRAGDQAVERRALNARGAIALVVGKPEEGADFFTQGLLAASRDNDLPAIGRCANNIGIVANIQGRHAEALSSYAMALAAFEQIGLHAGVAECHHNVGITRREQGDFDGALASAVRATVAANAAGDRNLSALALRGRAEIRLCRGEVEIAGREAREALDLHRGLNDPVGIAGDLRIVAAVLAKEGHSDQAEAMLREVIRQATSLERPQLEAEARRDLAMLLQREGRTDEARADARTARAIFMRMGAEVELRRLAAFEWDQEFGAEMRESLQPLHEAQELANAGRYAELLDFLGARSAQELERSPTLSLLKAVGHARIGQMDRAATWALTALMRSRATGDRSVEVRALNVSGAIALERGGISEAIHCFARAQEEAMLEGDLTTVGRAANNLGIIANMQGEHGRAIGAFTTALGAYQRARNQRGVAESHHNLGIAYRDQGMLKDALGAADEAVRLATQAEDVSLRAQAIAGRAEIRTASGDASLAIREARLAIDAHRAQADFVRVTEDQRILANALAAAGFVEEATSLLEETITQAEAFKRPLLVGITQRDLAMLTFQRGFAGEARVLAQRARGVFSQLGASAEVERIDLLLNRITAPLQLA
ncbi:MAG: tetratricopeptide repeat protein [Gemmatimonadaceae bacterium]